MTPLRPRYLRKKEDGNILKKIAVPGSQVLGEKKQKINEANEIRSKNYLIN